MVYYFSSEEYISRICVSVARPTFYKRKTNTAVFAVFMVQFVTSVDFSFSSFQIFSLKQIYSPLYVFCHLFSFFCSINSFTHRLCRSQTSKSETPIKSCYESPILQNSNSFHATFNLFRATLICFIE